MTPINYLTAKRSQADTRVRKAVSASDKIYWSGQRASFDEALQYLTDYPCLPVRYPELERTMQ